MLWSIADGTVIWEHKLPAEIECVTYSPNVKMVAAGDENFDIAIWETETGKHIKTIESDAGFDGIAWSTTDKYLGGGSENGDLYL